MPDPITEVKLTTTAEGLRLEWGMPVADGTRRWLWPGRTVEVRLYCAPYPAFGKPELLTANLDGRHTTRGVSFTIPFAEIGLGFTGEVTESAFRPGLPAADPSGRFYPVTLTFNPADIPDGGVICYPSLIWTVSSPDWLKQPFTAWAVFGHSERGTFIPIYELPPVEHKPEGVPALPAVAEEPLPESERVRRRGATPKLFISYSRHDLAAVNNIARRLGNEHYYDVWIDYDSIPGGALWQEEIARGILQAERVLFMATPYACASQWCQAEIARAQELGKTIIPIRLTSALTEADLKRVGLEVRNWVDFSGGDSDAAWTKLLASLPEVLARSKRMLDPAFRRQHRDYLRTLFARYGKISLSYLLDAAPRERVSLFDVYVPLFLGLRLWGEIKDSEMVDWWVVQYDQTGTKPVPFTADSPAEHDKRPKRFPRMEVEPAILGQVREQMREFVYELAKREGGVSDGEHSLWVIESEEAPALARHLVITGGPGSGKSTLLRHLALCLAGDMLREGEECEASLDNLGFWPLPAYTPVVVELRTLVRMAFPDAITKATLERFFSFVEETQLREAG